MMTEKVAIKIDQQWIEVEKGENLLQAARDAGIEIPRLCYHPKISANEACRLCIVKINGGAPIPSCTVQVEEAIEVTAFDEELETRRRMLLDLLLSEHNCNCINCGAAGSCDLQDLSYRYGLLGLNREKFRKIVLEGGLRRLRVPLRGANGTYQVLKERTYERFSFWCIRCGSCLEACPMNLYPVLIRDALKTNDERALERLHAADCINCGLCTYVCPSQIRLGRIYTGSANLESST